jgi:hypothetical protein
MNGAVEGGEHGVADRLTTVVLPIPPGPTMVKKRRAASFSEIS